MKKAISAFLTVGFVLSIVFLVLGPVFIIIGAISYSTATPEPALIGYGAVLLVFGIANLIGMIKIRQAWPKVTKKEDAIKIAVWCIVLGALFTTFPIVSGILMLAMPAEQYGKSE